MKKTLTLLLLTTLAAATAAQADDGSARQELRRTIKDTTTIVALELTPKTVFCTERGYGTVQLKVSLPDLDWLAHFDHRVVGERLPCITGGACGDELNPGKLLDPSERVVLAPVRVELVETLRIDRDKKTCERRLDERVTSQIRGRKFNHFRGTPDFAPVDFEICDKLMAR